MRMSKSYFEQAFLEQVDRGRALTVGMVRASVDTDPDAYPFVLEMLNEVLLAGINADTIGGSEPDTLRWIAKAIRQVLHDEDAASEKFITAV
jgi:hypothetical protein